MPDREPPRQFWIGFDVAQICTVAGVGQLVEHGDPRAVPASKRVPYEPATDEAGPARYKKVCPRRGPRRAVRIGVEPLPGCAHLAWTPAGRSTAGAVAAATSTPR